MNLIEKSGSLAASRTSEEPVPASRSLTTRFCYEWWWRTPLFELRDPVLGAELDVQQTFAPRPIWKTRVIRLALLFWTLQILWIDMHLFRFPWFYFAFFSQVTFGLTIGYFVVSTCVAFAGPLRQPRGHCCSRPSLLVCIYWVRIAEKHHINYCCLLCALTLPLSLLRSRRHTLPQLSRASLLSRQCIGQPTSIFFFTSYPRTNGTHQS